MDDLVVTQEGGTTAVHRKRLLEAAGDATAVTRPAASQCSRPGRECGRRVALGGQGVSMDRPLPAGELVAVLMDEALEVTRELSAWVGRLG